MDFDDFHDAIRTVAETEHFGPLFAHFAEDIELTISVTLQSSAREERRGREVVARRLQRLYDGDMRVSEQRVDTFASGDRVVACRDATLTIAGGLTVRDQCALVFDVRDGLVERLAIHHELSTCLEAGLPGVSSAAPSDERNRIERALAETDAS